MMCRYCRPTNAKFRNSLAVIAIIALGIAGLILLAVFPVAPW